MAIYGVVSSNRLHGKSWTALDTIGIVAKAQMNLDAANRRLRLAQATASRCERELLMARNTAKMFIRSLSGGEFVAGTTDKSEQELEEVLHGSE